MKKTKCKIVWGIFLLCTLLLNSCKDSMLSEEIEGTWETSVITSYDDGTKGHRNDQLTFKRGQTTNNGGVFSEKCIYEDEIDDEEGNIKYKYTSTIEGTWEIKKGNLSLHYNISTLEVTLRKKDVEFDWQYVIADSCGSSSIFEDGYEQDQFIKKLKKHSYKELFRYYKEFNKDTDDDDLSYSNVEIKGSVLSFDTSDVGRVEYNRVKNIHPITNDEEDKTKDESDYQHERGGVIGDYQVSMYYDIDKDNNVSGYYYYGSQGPEKKICFTGKIVSKKSKEQLTLKCENQDIFDGYFDENRSNYTGTFSNINNKKLEFVLYKMR